MSRPPSRHHADLWANHGSAFGEDAFGKFAEFVARFLGTPQYLITQTIGVAAWIAANVALVSGWDPYPFILLNLLFSTQASYAAPLILLAQTRQAERDRAQSEADALHREAQTSKMLMIIERDVQLSIEVQALTTQIHEMLALNTRMTAVIRDLTENAHKDTELPEAYPSLIVEPPHPAPPKRRAAKKESDPVV